MLNGRYEITMEIKKNLHYSFLTCVYVILILDILFLIILLTPAFDEIVFPAYMSVVTVCDVVDSCDEVNLDNINKSAVSRGYVLGGVYDPSDDKITLFDDDPAILVHEECHRQQFKDGKSYGCDYKIFKFMSELECYIAQWRSN